jgi:hypothetical protein
MEAFDYKCESFSRKLRLLRLLQRLRQRLKLFPDKWKFFSLL